MDLDLEDEECQKRWLVFGLLMLEWVIVCRVIHVPALVVDLER